MPSVTPLLAADPARIGRYRLAGRLGGSPGDRSRPAAATRQDGPAPAVVYLGRTADGETVTITLLQPIEATDSAARDMFVAEADAARQVAPFCVARMLDAGFHGDFPYLVSEHIPGPSLAEAVLAEGPPAEDVLRAIAIGAATGLAAIHQVGLVHGHFSAHQLILGPEGPRVVHSGVTPPFGPATPAADVLAWARAVLFATTGRPGDKLPRPEDLHLLGSPLRELVTECLDAEPGDRPPAKVIVTRLLGHTHPPTGILAAGTRIAAPARTPARTPARGPARAPARTPARTPARGPARTAVRTPTRTAAGPPPRAAAPAPAATDDHTIHRRPRPGYSQRAAVAGIAVAVLAVSAAITAVVLGHSGGARGSASNARPSRVQQAGTPSATPSTGLSASSAAPPTPSGRVPVSLSGTWSGQVRQAVPQLSFDANVQLTAGSATGTVSYPAFGCSGVLTLTSESGSRFVFQQGIVQGQRTCGQGTVTLTLHDPTLGFAFSPATPGGPALHGTLSRQ